MCKRARHFESQMEETLIIFRTSAIPLFSGDISPEKHLARTQQALELDKSSFTPPETIFQSDPDAVQPTRELEAAVLSHLGEKIRGRDLKRPIFFSTITHA